ncbi:capZ-interacting protein [Clupea harengus]|uniref:CapZ-interacting protein n=1 Tax=Clupea harengus TaxID=7950 RepID=A0A6P3W2G1_CLUHA|nr:capZ-interacting protein [Clupea harengus]
MEEDCTVKPSVAELAGRFKGHPLPMPTANEERRSVRKRPPCSLNFQNKKDGEGEPEKPAIVSPVTPKGKLKNSPLFEKIQANLALSPTALSPEVKLQATPFPPAGPTPPCSPPCTPLSPTQRQPQTQTSEEEVPVSFEQPAEGTPLPNINKCRPRVSFKRRQPTRQHRKSATEDPELSPSGEQNGDGADVFDEPTKGRTKSINEGPDFSPDEPTKGRTSPQPSVVKKTSEKDEEGVEDATEAQEEAASGEQDADHKAPLEGQPEEQQELDPKEVVIEESQQTIEKGASPGGGDSSGKD